MIITLIFLILVIFYHLINYTFRQLSQFTIINKQNESRCYIYKVALINIYKNINTILHRMRYLTNVITSIHFHLLFLQPAQTTNYKIRFKRL